MKTRLVTAVLGAAVLVSSMAVGATASEADNWRDLPVAKANPGVSEEVITSLPEEVQQSDVHIDDSYEPGQLILDTEGTPLEGQDASTLAAWPNCTLQAYGPPLNSWGNTSTCGTAIFGHEGYSHYYSWSRVSDTQGCMRFRGFNILKERTWYTAGCGNFNSVSVPWGNVLSNPAAQAKSQSFATGWLADWQG